MIEGDELDQFERSVRHATGTRTGAALDGALVDLGWDDALSVDPRAAVSLLFSLQGEANVTSSALDRVLADALGRDGCAVVLPAVGQRDAPGLLRGTWVEVDGICTIALDGHETALIVARAGASHVAVEVAVRSLPQRRIEGIDPSLGIVESRGDVAVVGEVGEVDWPSACGLGQIALGHELVGASRRMLELARQHALDRVQFGQPIAKFQAIRHRLAETLVAIEAADAALVAAWSDPSSQSAAIAKATAGRGARVAARHCQQVLAGIGFTTEHKLHRYVRRILILEQLLGATRSLTRQLGDDILANRRLPPLLAL